MIYTPLRSGPAEKKIKAMRKFCRPSTVDFSMVSAEIHWAHRADALDGLAGGCLFNQETDEYPLLYWAHPFKAGDPYTLAQQVRKGLDRLDIDA